MDTSGSEKATPRVPSLEAFGLRLALIRVELGLNYREMADLCGVGSDQAWANWESGVKPRDVVATARQIAEKTGYDMTWLLLGPLGDSPSNRWFTDKMRASGIAAAA